MRRSNSARKFRKYLLILFVVTMLAAGAGWVVYRWPEPPVIELRDARTALMAAREAEADKYAPGLYKNTSQLYEAAMTSWKKENERFLLNRNFVKTKVLAAKAAQTGKEATRKAVEKAHTLHQGTGVTLVELEKIKKNFERIYAPLPLSKSVRSNFSKGVLLLSEAKLARERSDLPLANEKLQKAKTLLVTSDSKARTMLEEYFSALPKWKTQVKTAIAQSASQNSPVVVINKMEHQCLLYEDGQLKNTFKVEFGPNWIGNKTHKGDMATPEGYYRIIHKKDQRKTIYHKALSLNYPNEEDRARYRTNVASGFLSRRQDIGGSIEIHGGGGRGFNWTKGCVSLTDRDIDVLYGTVSENTPVIIVGSLEPLEKYIN